MLELFLQAVQVTTAPGTPIIVEQASTLALWLAFGSLLIPTILTPIITYAVSVKTQRNQYELKSRVNEIHYLVDGQKGILLENLAVSLEANVVLLMANKSTDANVISKAVEASKIARAAAADHANQLARARDQGVRIIESTGK